MSDRSSISPLLDALSRVSTALQRQDLSHVFIGGIALVAWSRPRTTVDVDVLVLHEDLDPLLVLHALEKEGFQLADAGIHTDVMMAGFRAYRKYKDPTLSVVPVDVLVSNNPVVFDIVQRAKKRFIGDREIMVPSVEDLILLKLQAGRLQDLADAQAIMKTHQTTLDNRYLHKQASSFGVENELEKVVSSL